MDVYFSKQVYRGCLHITQRCFDPKYIKKRVCAYRYKNVMNNNVLCIRATTF